jgi:hypothetical protein
MLKWDIGFAVVIVAIILGFILFRKKGISPFAFMSKSSESIKQREFTDEQYECHYKFEEQGLERLLGPMHELVGHALIPFQIGGNVDMYYFPNGIEGTGFATMELIEPDGSGPKPNRIGTYELVSFTKHKIPPEETDKDQNHSFNKIERRMCGIMTVVGFYSHEAVLNPGETCEVPMGEGEANVCLIFDEYSRDGLHFEINGKRHCLLLCVEVFRSEMEYAMKHGSAVVLTELKKKGYYPYSDLDRKPVF